MSDVNPFAAGAAIRADSENLDLAATYLRQTRPWLLFMGIVTVLAAAFCVLAGLGLFALGAAVNEMGAMGPVIGVFYVVIGAFYGVPGFLLIQQASAIGS